MAAGKTAKTKAPAKKKATRKAATATKAAKKSAASETRARKAAGRKATAAEKTPAKKAATKKSPAKKVPAAKKAPAKKAPAKKAPAKKAPATRGTAKKAPVVKGASEEAAHTFSAAFLEAQRAALIEQRATYERQSRSLRDEAASLVEDFQSGDVQFDEESGEGDTLNVAREQDLMMSSQAQSNVEEIDHALAKFDLGTYGLCEVSGKPIPEARLEAIPWARERIEYKVGGLTSR